MSRLEWQIGFTNFNQAVFALLSIVGKRVAPQLSFVICVSGGGRTVKLLRSQMPNCEILLGGKASLCIDTLRIPLFVCVLMLVE